VKLKKKTEKKPDCVSRFQVSWNERKWKLQTCTNPGA